MADDDDDDFFGNFKVASKPHSASPTTAVSAGVNPIGDAGDLFSDDDWGDFVTTPSGQINGGDSAALTRYESPPSWTKPSGALPLSLFGVAEEDGDKSGAGEPTFGVAEPVFFGKKGDRDDDGKKKVSSLNGGVGIGDLIANLYRQNEKNDIQNGLEANSKVDQAISNVNGSNLNQNGFDFVFQDSNFSSSKLDYGANGFNFISNGSNSDLVQKIENFDDDDDDDVDDEDDGWEFKGANETKQEQRAVEGLHSNAYTLNGKQEEIQVDCGGRENIEESRPIAEFTNGSHGSANTLILSKDASYSGWNFVFDSVSSSVSQDNHLWASYSKTEKDGLEIGSSFSYVVEKGSSSEKILRFEDEFSQTGLEPKLEEVKVSAPADLGGKAGSGDGADRSMDFFAVSKGTVHGPQEWDVAFTFDSSSASENHIIKDVTSKSNVNDSGNVLSSFPDDRHVESEDDTWEFKDAVSETGSKNEGTDVKSESHREALPLSLFGDDELETNISPMDQDVSSHTPNSHTRKNYNASGSNLSLNDLISSLYGQAEKSTSVHDTAEEMENGVPSTTRQLESDPVYPVDDFDDDSWEFKDASWDGKAQNQTFRADFEASPTKSSNKLQFNDFLDFYSKLKDEACLVALSHFQNLKKAQGRGSDPLCGEDLEEIQKVVGQLCRDNMISDLQLENHSLRSGCLSELLEVLQEPKFKMLESVYHLSNMFSLAEKDLGSAIELSKHATSTVRILELGSAEEKSTYAFTWSKIVVVCAQELRHGASIWKQALQKNVQSEILSQLKGRQYIIALGEIYRVVQVVGVSVELYKPWILVDSEETIGLFALLNECTTLWSTSGLDEALESISDSFDSELDGASRELLDSIKYIYGLQAPALQNDIFSGKQTFCRLLLLTSEIVPGMKLVAWDGEQYMLKLANLWANLISSNPPALPHLKAS